MKIRISILLFTLFGVLASQAQEKKWTLRECVEYAIENSISIKQSELDLETASLDKLAALGNFVPDVSGSGTLSSNTGANINPVTNTFETTTFSSFTTGVNVGLTLFDGLRNLRQLQRAKLNKLLSQYNLGKSKDDIALFVANSYLQILVNKESLKVIEKQHEITLEQLKRTKDLVDAGVLPQGDLLEIEATSADELTRIVQAENSVLIARVGLAQTLLIQDYENFDIAEQEYLVPSAEILNKSIDEIRSTAREARYEVQIAEQNKLLAEKDVQLARGSYYPTLNAFFGYNTRWSDNDTQRDFVEQLYLNDGFAYGLQLNVPILSGFSTRTNVKRNKINVTRTEFQLEQAKLDLDSNVYQAYLDAKGSAEAYEASLVSVKAQERAYEYAKNRYDVGLTNAFDFSQSKFRLENAQSQEVQNKFDYIFKLKVLELYFGIKIADIRL
ncbi:TolC family protein [Aquimarina mytili]|uniref:TolC family protein n=1 Tax=Aquimarina mytili TaxID=874423 RepID=A0A937A288_9FLAO|nr:TolC family protein [Aquimarina mytili]MBL0683660.1 TolC family protein [Aquimarina mytili]